MVAFWSSQSRTEVEGLLCSLANNRDASMAHTENQNRHQNSAAESELASLITEP